MRNAIKEIEQIVSSQLGVFPVGEKQRLVEDLGAESIDLMNIVAAVEKRFQVVLEEEALPDIKTICDLHRAVQTGKKMGVSGHGQPDR
jgi:acyl carrier protein